MIEQSKYLRICINLIVIAKRVVNNFLYYLILISFARVVLKSNIRESYKNKWKLGSMNSLIQPPQISQEIISRMVEGICMRYQLKDVIPTSEFGEDTARVFEQLQLYSSTILQLQTLNNAANHRLLELFHQNMFKFTRFLSKLIARLSKNQTKEPQSHTIDQICKNCQDHLQDRNIKQLKRELYDFNIPNFDRNLDEESSESPKDEEEDISNEENLIRKMTKLQKNVNERQIGLIRCLQQFQVARNQMMADLLKQEQKEKDCLTKFNYHEYAFQISWFFANGLKKIQDKINSLRLSVKKQEDKGVQVICVEMGISRMQQNMPLSLLKCSQNHRSGNIKTELELRKSNEARSRLEEMVKHYQVENKEMQTRVSVLQDQIKGLHEQFFEEKLKNNLKSKITKNIEKLPEARSKTKKQLKEELKQHHDMISQIINEDNGLSRELQERILQKCNDLKLPKDKVKDIIPLFKSAFKKTVDAYVNKRINSTVDPKKLLKFQKNDQETPEKTEDKIVRKKTNVRIQMIRQTLKEGTEFATIETGSHFKITEQCRVKIVNNNKKQQQGPKQISKIQEKIGTIIKHKKSVLLTEGNSNTKNHSRFSSTFYEPKSTEDKKYNRDSMIHKKSRQLRKSQINFQSLNILGYESNDKKIKMIPINRNSSRQQIHPAHKVVKSRVSLNDLLQTYKIDCSLMDQRVLKDFIRNQQTITEEENQQQKSIGKTKIKDLSKYSPISCHVFSNKGYINKIILRIDQINYLTTFYTLMARAHIIHPKLYAQVKSSLFQQSTQNGNVSDGEGNLMMKKMLGQIVVRHRKCINIGICIHMQNFISAIQQSLNQCSPQRQSN